MKVWQYALWISAITLHSTRSQSPDQDGWIREALDLFNKREDGEFFFKFLSALPDVVQEEENDPTIAFLIKETECLKSEDINIEECDYKKDGEVKVCGLYSEKGKAVASLKCVSLTKTLHTKRARNKKECTDYYCRLLKKVGSTSHIQGVIPLSS